MDNVLSDNGFYSTTSQTTVPILMYGPPRAAEKLQIVRDNDDGPGHLVAVMV